MQRELTAAAGHCGFLVPWNRQAKQGFVLTAVTDPMTEEKLRSAPHTVRARLEHGTALQRISAPLRPEMTVPGELQPNASRTQLAQAWPPGSQPRLMVPPALNTHKQLCAEMNRRDISLLIPSPVAFCFLPPPALIHLAPCTCTL